MAQSRGFFHAPYIPNIRLDTPFPNQDAARLEQDPPSM
jgi:hypothetical protein